MHALPTAMAAPAQDRSAAPADFVRRHQQGLWRFVRSLGCRGAEADDVCQEALLVALGRGVPATHGDRDATAFLRQTGKFLWLRRQRDDHRRAARLAAMAESLWQRECQDDAGEELLAALDPCLDALPARSRRVLDRVYRDGAGRAELAAELRMTEHGVRTLLQRVRKALRKCIEGRTS